LTYGCDAADERPPLGGEGPFASSENKGFVMKEKRRRIWIDRFQTLLFLRIALYFILYQLAVWSLFAIGSSLSEVAGRMAGQSIGTYTFLFASLVILLLGGLFICDAIILTHRIVGPIYRFRKMVQAVTAGGEVDRMGLRKGDFLHELKDEFNEMLVALEQRGAIVIKSREPARQKDQAVSV
jgi:hypothetical protein